MQTELYNSVEKKIAECISIIEKRYSVFPHTVMVRYDLTGAIAGKAYCKDWRIRINYRLLEKNPDEMVNQTIPHEICHLLAWHYLKGKGHGREWKHMMGLLGLSAKRCHSYDLQEAMPERFMVFSCNCSQHTVGFRKGHTIIANMERYWCKKCKGRLKWIK